MARVVPLIRPFVADGGYAFTASVPEDVPSYVRGGALSFVLEDGRPLSPSDSLHDHIRAYGCGAYSLWRSRLYFSASDNSDCNANGREYSLVLVSLSSASDQYSEVIGRIAKDDALLLALINRNCGYNKSLMLNFLGYYNLFRGFLERYGAAQPSLTLELGSGERPYVALRWLMEGATRCVVNDVAPIEGAFTPQFVDHLRTFVDLAWPGGASRLDRLLMPADAGGLIHIRGLEICDRQPFEEIDIDGGFDLVYSVSVLEHVMNPRGVVAKMQQLLRPGGYACHSIDLRDHANFEDPLGFLRLSEEEYALRRTENRLRASDWFALFDELGLTLIGREFVACQSALNPQHRYSETEPSEPWVTESVRQGLTSPFDTKGLADLSTIAVRVLYQNPL